MLLCGHVPAAFGTSYTAPITKDNNVRGKAMLVDDFRGIAISPIISKIFESCILDRFKVFLTSDDNQYGFKNSLVCTHAIYAVRKIVDRFITNGSTMNLCSLDLSKAFDKVNHHALFIKLMNRCVPINLLRLLESWYSNCHTCIKWNSVISRFFNIRFGVRQGSALSPTIFSVYVNDIVSRLHFSVNKFTVLYADDILLMAPSVTELQRMLILCETELTWLDMTINVKKSCCIRVGPRYNAPCVSLETASGITLPWVLEIRYLGTFIISSRLFKCSISHAKRAFYCAANSIFW
jgi:hypothetical protein